MGDLTAIIPVRAGSERVINKNFKPFADKNLLRYKIDVVKKLPVSKIVINTDSDYAIEVAKEEGIDYHRREDYYASSICTNSEYHTYLANSTDSENILIAQVTAPLISVNSFVSAIDVFNKSQNDSLISVQKQQHYLWYNGKPVNYDPSKDSRSQNLPIYYKPTFGIIICNKQALLRDRNVICGSPIFYELSEIESVDIDTDFDFEFAEYLYKKNLID